MLEQKVAYIDLSTGKTRTELIPERMRRLYLGGRGMSAYLLYNHIAPGTDPLGPDNVLTVNAGLLGGTMSPSSGRCDMGTKSPLTGLLGDCNMGGFFAPELRFAGFDHLVITGRAEKPVYLMIRDGDIEIRDAARLWGKDTGEVPSIIRKEQGDEELKVLCIGIAGENLVRFANVISGLKNAGGRTGVGCVMGSKKLKAIAVRGTGGIPITRPAEALDCAQKFVALIRENIVFKDLSRFGTPTNHRDANALGRLRNRNFQRNQVPGGESLYADRLEEFSIGMAACFGCPVHCRHRYIVPEGPTRGSYAEGPEWCTIGALGSELDVGRMEALLVLNQMVNRYGMDSLEFGSMLAWAIELYEKGIIDDRATGGLKLEWGHEQVMYEMIQRTAHREGLGDVLAEGPLRAIEKLGQESAFYNIHVKGMSWLHTDERPTPTMALGVAVSTRGADHLRSRPGTDTYVMPPDVREKMYGFAPPAKITSYEGGGKTVRWHELVYAISDSLGVCKFQALFMSPSTIGYEQYSQMLGHVTGMELSPAQMTEAAERIYTLERMFNNREGAGRKDDNLPERYYVEPTPLGVRSFQGKTIDRVKFGQQLDEYYDAHGWDRNGVPTPETLRKLGLHDEPSHLL